MQVVVLLLICLGNLMAIPTHTQTPRPRMIFTDTDRDSFKRLSLHGNDAHIQLLLGQQDVVTAAGKTHLYFANFHNLQLSSKTPAFGSECSGSDPVSNCQYNITVIHKRKDDQLFMCGNNGGETTCCNMNMSEPSALCTPAEQFASIKQVHIKEGEPSVLIESSSGEELYVTHSGTEESVGIHKSGMNRVRPDNHRKEQKYVSLVVSNRTIDQQNKIFAFYNEKKTDPSMNSDMWLPFVSQVCMADCGGSKLYRQFEWTSQLQARLYCGDKSSKHYSELVDVATLHADQWQDTRVYALFRNEWGTSAVCEYTVGDIEYVFTTSKFKGFTETIPDPRPGTCTGDRAAMATLTVVENHSEMEDTIQPHRAFISPHHYTHLCVDSLHNQTVLLLSLENGGVQKVLENDTQTFIIAEYRPFSHRAHVDNMILNPSTKKLYVSSSREIVQINLESCAQYGDSCQECALARDPYCAWDGTHCSPATSDTHNMEEGNQHACSQSNALSSPEAGVKEYVDPIMVPRGSKHFLQCPISSLHAEYSWHHDSKNTPCNPTEDNNNFIYIAPFQKQVYKVQDHCLLLIDSMSSKDEGLYWCERMEKGYIKTLAQYRLQLESGATGPPMSVTLTSFCLIVAAVILR